jgi:acylphosphatase
MASAPVALLARVVGLVQGVGFRRFAEDAARAHSVRGWVRNRADRSVECHAEGDAADVEAFLEALREGPPASRVVEVRTEPAPLERAAGFTVRATR